MPLRNSKIFYGCSLNHFEKDTYRSIAVYRDSQGHFTNHLQFAYTEFIFENAKCLKNTSLLEMSLPQVFFKHFASKCKLSGLSVNGTLAKNESKIAGFFSSKLAYIITVSLNFLFDLFMHNVEK